MSDETGNAPRGGFGKWWIASAVLMAVVVLGLVYVLFPRDDATGTNTDTDASSSPSTATDSPSTTAPEEGGEGWDDEGCNDTSGSSEIPTSAPDDVQWVPLGAMSVPVSNEYGPRELADPPLRQCFQHSPVGALFAAINIKSAAGTNSSSEFPVLQEQMTAGPVRDTWLTAAADGNDPARSSIAGFRVAACAADRCGVDLILSEGGALSQASLTMVWSAGDWLLDGSVEPPASLVEAIPAGFTPWAPGM